MCMLDVFQPSTLKVDLDAHFHVLYIHLSLHICEGGNPLPGMQTLIFLRIYELE